MRETVCWYEELKCAVGAQVTEPRVVPVIVGLNYTAAFLLPS